MSESNHFLAQKRRLKRDHPEVWQHRKAIRAWLRDIEREYAYDDWLSQNVWLALRDFLKKDNTMLSDFERAHEFVARWEGGFVDDPQDPGGATKWGITIRTLIAKGLDLNNDGAVNRKDIHDMTPEQALSIYRIDYWERARCPELPFPVALVHYDAAVNQGVSRAVRFLQQAVRVRVDGVIGPVTLAAVRRAEVRGLVTEYCARRAVHYSSLAIVTRFGLGWFRRLFDAQAEALS